MIRTEVNEAPKYTRAYYIMPVRVISYGKKVESSIYHELLLQPKYISSDDMWHTIGCCLLHPELNRRADLQ